MFTLIDYVGPWAESPDWSEDRQGNANFLISICAKLQDELENNGVHFLINPKTGTTISGEQYGGFRPQDCPIGALGSAHKEGQAVDRYDPSNLIDAYITQFDDGNGGNSLLEKVGLYREHPDSTPGWSHWTTRAPASGHRTFMP